MNIFPSIIKTIFKLQLLPLIKNISFKPLKNHLQSIFVKRKNKKVYRSNNQWLIKTNGKSKKKKLPPQYYQLYKILPIYSMLSYNNNYCNIYGQNFTKKKNSITSKHIIKKILVTYIQIWLITRYTICLIGLHHTDSTPAKYRIQNTKNKIQCMVYIFVKQLLLISTNRDFDYRLFECAYVASMLQTSLCF